MGKKLGKKKDTKQALRNSINALTRILATQDQRIDVLTDRVEAIEAGIAPSTAATPTI